MIIKTITNFIIYLLKVSNNFFLTINHFMKVKVNIITYIFLGYIKNIDTSS